MTLLRRLLHQRHGRVGWYWYSGRRQFSCDCGATWW